MTKAATRIGPTAFGSEKVALQDGQCALGVGIVEQRLQLRSDVGRARAVVPDDVVEVVGVLVLATAVEREGLEHHVRAGVAHPEVPRPEFIIRDRDSKFGADFDRAAVGAGTRVIKCPVRSPLVNATCERFLGSVRRECLDHIVLGGLHLEATLSDYVAYFNASRPHQGLKQRIPIGSATLDAQAAGAFRAIPILGGLHHDYRRAA